MIKYFTSIILAIFLLSPLVVFSKQIQADEKLNIVVIFAHPDDGDLKMGATAAMMAEAGHRVKFVSITNGSAGHQELGGGNLGSIRRAEAEEAARRMGIDEYVVMDNNDGELMPDLHIRMDVIREIRNWDADAVFGVRPWDYHPDHRYSGVLVQDAAYMVGVPNLASDTPPLEKNPIFFYLSDRFEKPYPFMHDVVVGIDSHIETKLDAVEAHVTQVYEWLPWIGGRQEVPESPEDRRQWLTDNRFSGGNVSDEQRAGLAKWYGEDKANDFQHVESFEICEYGRRPTDEDIRRIFPMLPQD
ncbi:MAG: PIG-L deacetylase family protein [Balneolales bacterium]